MGTGAPQGLAWQRDPLDRAQGGTQLEYITYRRLRMSGRDQGLDALDQRDGNQQCDGAPAVRDPDGLPRPDQAKEAGCLLAEFADADGSHVTHVAQA